MDSKGRSSCLHGSGCSCDSFRHYLFVSEKEDAKFYLQEGVAALEPEEKEDR